MSKICPKCGLMNADDRVVCTNCGVVLPAMAPQQGVPNPVGPYPAQAPTPVYAPYQPAPVPVEPKKRYSALRTVSTIFSVLAWIGLIGGILTGIFGGIAMSAGFDSGFSNGMGVFGIILGILVGAIMGLLSFLMFKVYAELINVAIDVEENTRKTAEALAALKK